MNGNSRQNLNEIFTRRNDDEDKSLVIISTPYRHGCHVATNPLQFIPIIDHLIELHKHEFVHGDIRACNIVFGDLESDEGLTVSKESFKGSGMETDIDDTTKKQSVQIVANSKKYKGWLIDFDFGKHILMDPKYPEGYIRNLDDGRRIGESGDVILPWHDWYALGQVIFDIHKFILAKGVSESQSKGIQINAKASLYDIEKFWTRIVGDPKDKDIEDLKTFLKNIHDLDLFDVESWEKHKENTTQTFTMETNDGASGSPTKK